MTPGKPPTGLGRGLGELFQRTGPAAPSSAGPSPAAADHSAPANQAPAELSDGSYLVELAVAAIEPNPEQPRTDFDPDQLSELAASIKEVGLLQPIVVRPLGGQSYQLVAGERRWRAAQLAQLSVIPAVVRPTDEGDLLRDALLENLHRVQLNPLEEAAAYQQLLTDFGCTHDELSQRVQRSRPYISNTIRLLRLPPPVQRRVASGVLSAGHARALLGLDDSEQIERLAQRIVAEGLSVRATEEAVTLGEGRPDKPRRVPRARTAHPKAVMLSERLSDRFDTRVKVEMGRAKGKITIEFAAEDDLDRILTLLVPSLLSQND
ncbi:MAG: ParB/RepB/Spo0J family partition protein [Propionibacteriaceae bacterium]|jgi:ParB family chromosome partitioning protein|nr:ParB/RepB/Spo0J family partition protein [Propionibacteriaceae bacterium]